MAVSAEQMSVSWIFGDSLAMRGNMSRAAKKNKNASSPLNRRGNLMVSGTMDTPDVAAHLHDIAQESDACVAMTAAILAQDWDAAFQQAAMLPELHLVVAQCDRDRDPSLGVTLATYAYRVAASHNQERVMRKLMRFIRESEILDRIIGRALLIERIPDMSILTEEIRDRLVMLLCHESLARRIWAGHTIYFDPTKNTVKGWLSHPLVRRGLLMRGDIFTKHHETFNGNVDLLESLSDERLGENPVLDVLTGDVSIEPSVSVFDKASLQSLGDALRDLVDRYGVTDSRKALQSILRYKARTSPRIFERKALIVQALAVVIAVHPVISVHIIQEQIPSSEIAAACHQAKMIMEKDDVSDSSASVREWIRMVGDLHDRLVTDLSDGGYLDLSETVVRGGRRQIKACHLRAIRQSIGEILSEHLEIFCGDQELDGRHV